MSSAELTPAEKKQLLEIAHESVIAVVNGAAVPEFQVDSPALQEKRGAFVTLHKHGELRGCIGYIVPVKALYLTVSEAAGAAAVRDWRFNPVQPRELSQLTYEISALSPLKTISSIDEIEVGRHGLIIEKGMHKGLLLPQVATEWHWDREEFLRHTCQKAGLPMNSWQDEDCHIQIFSAHVFGDADFQ